VRITKLHKDNGSGLNGCPALYTADAVHPNYAGTDRRPGYVVQGLSLDPDTLGQLDQLDDTETGVWVPANVIDRLVEQRLAGRGAAA
jgi:hypothetical protein